jgi:hypothetical protein
VTATGIAERLDDLESPGTVAMRELRRIPETVQGTAEQFLAASVVVGAAIRQQVSAAELIALKREAKTLGLLKMGEFDRVAREAASEDARDSGERAPSVATQLVELAQELYTFGVSDLGEPFGIPAAGPKVVAMLRGSKTSLRALLAREFFARTGRAATQQALSDALLVVEGMAQEREPSRLYMRCAQHQGALWLDLGDHTGRAVKVTAAGWTVEDEPPVLFKRTALTGALPEPQDGGTLGGLWGWLNVSEKDRPLVAAELVARLFSDQPHVVLAIFGEHGTGKTTAVKVLVMLLDPGPVPVRKPPRDADSWVTAAAGSWVVGLDNLSDIPPWLSDSLCRASTGEGDVRRKLHTDGDLAVFSFRRCIIFDSIDVGAMAPDLADRALPVTLARIADKDRKDEEAFWPAWNEAHPKLLGAVLGLAAAVMARIPAIKLAKKPRMADFARILAAVDAELGTNGLARYRLQATALAADGLSGDSLAVCIQETVTGSFEGTSAQLLKLVTPDGDEWRAPKDWPKDARDVTGKMSRLAPAFRKIGWTVTNLGSDNHDKVVRWFMSSPPAEEGSPDDPREPPQDPQGAGDAGMRGGQTDFPPPPSERDISACPRHQTSWGPRGHCPDCEALALPANGHTPPLQWRSDGASAIGDELAAEAGQ